MKIDNSVPLKNVQRYDAWVKVAPVTGEFVDLSGNVWPQAWIDSYNRFSDRIKLCMTLHPEEISGSLADQEINFYLDQRHRHYVQCMAIANENKGLAKAA